MRVFVAPDARQVDRCRADAARGAVKGKLFRGILRVRFRAVRVLDPFISSGGHFANVAELERSAADLDRRIKVRIVRRDGQDARNVGSPGSGTRGSAADEEFVRVVF